MQCFSVVLSEACPASSCTTACFTAAMASWLANVHRRVKSAASGTVTYYAFDGLNVLTDYDGAVSARRSYVVPFLDDSLVLRTEGNDYYYTRMFSVRSTL